MNTLKAAQRVPPVLEPGFTMTAAARPAMSPRLNARRTPGIQVDSLSGTEPE
jgi:hypothetical protein